MIAAPEPPRTCRNCNAAVAETYCQACGQRWLRNPDPTIGALARELLQEVTNMDGKIIQTFRTLLTRPGQLTVDFLAGRRARHVTPFRLYFLTSLLLFVGTPLFHRMTGTSTRWRLNFTVADDSAVTSGRRSGAPAQTGSVATVSTANTPNALRHWINSHRDELRARFREESFGADVIERLPRVIFVLLPFFAGLLWIVYRPRRMRFPRHLYVAVHLHAAFFFLVFLRSFLDLVPSATVSSAALAVVAFYMVWYVAAALKRVYGGAWAGALVRLAVVSVLYSATLSLAFLASVIATALAS